MERKKDIFLAGNDAVGHLAGPLHKKYFMTFIWGHPFSMCRCYDQFFDPSHTPLCTNLEYPSLSSM